jgi:Domain of unknown function (DUF4440)
MGDAVSIARDLLLAADDARYQALMASDIGALDRLLTDDFTYTHNAGFCDDKAGYLDRIRRGAVRYSDWVRVSANIRIYGAAGVMTGHMRMIANLPNQAVQLDNLYLAAWVRLGRQWRLAAWSSTSRGKTS